MTAVVALSDADLHVHVYKLLHERELRHDVGIESSYRSIDLPAASLDGLWDSYVQPVMRHGSGDSADEGRLVFEPGLKSKLLGFLSTICLSPPSTPG